MGGKVDGLSGLAAADAVLIDASSTIYLLKAGCLGYLAACIRLLSPPEAVRETGWRGIGIEVLEHAHGGTATDTVLVACAAERNLPLVTDDRPLAARAAAAGITTWQALQMLHLLLLRGSISRDHHAECRERLLETAGYRPEELHADERLFAQVLRHLQPDGFSEDRTV